MAKPWRVSFLAAIFFLSLFAPAPFLFSQDVVDDFWVSRHLSILHDFGDFWPLNTAFRPYRWQSLSRADFEHAGSEIHWILEDLRNERRRAPTILTAGNDSLRARWWNGLLLQQPAGSGEPFSQFSGAAYSHLTFWFRQRLSLQLYFRAASDPASLPHFTGRPRDIRRLGLNSAEFDHAAFSYDNRWLTLQFGRARQNWGPFEENNLVLSNRSAAFDHLMAEFRYKRFKGRFFYGFLESLASEAGNINRYLVGHGVEYSNRRNLVVGVSEIIVFSGLNRPLDMSYLNPFLPVLEVEQNHRTNAQMGSASSNAIWSIGADWMPLRGLRFAGQLAIDEFQLDQADREQGRPDAVAYQFRAAYSRGLATVPITFFVEYGKVGSLTFRHEIAANNFVSRNLPLGSGLGSDADRWQLGTRLVLPFRFIAELAYGRQREGEGSVLLNPYAPVESFTQLPFPSGRVQRTRFLEWRMSYLPLRNFEVQVAGRAAAGRTESNDRYVIFSVNAYLPWSFGL